MNGDGKLTQAEHDAMQAASADWNMRALAAENEAMDKQPHDLRPPEPWTLDGIPDERDRARSDDWRLAQRWPWVDAIAWIALGGAEVLPLLYACRSMFGRKVGADPLHVERECWAVLKTRVDHLRLEDAERVLRAWCRSGLIPVDDSGTSVALPEHRRPYEAMFAAADIQRLAVEAPATPASLVPEVARAPSKAGRKKGQDTYPEDAAIVAKIIALCDEQALPLPKAINRLITEIAPVHLDDAAKKKRIRPKVLAQRPDLAN